MISARNIISPAQPGITAALGLLVTDLKYEYTRSVLIPLNDATTDQLENVNNIVDELKNEADMQLDQDMVPKDQRQYEYIMECRYLGQGFELRAKMPNKPLTKDNVSVVIDSFYDVHKQQYGHAFKDQITEAITIRVVASVDTDKLTFTDLEKGGVKNPDCAHLYNRDTTFDDGKSVSTPRYARDKLKAGDYLTGPAVVTQHNSTTIIPPGYRATMLDAGDIIIENQT
jgi:N-methylhydantoinase A